MAREIGDRRGEGTARFNAALALAALGELDPALARAEEALKIFQAIEAPYVEQVWQLIEEWRGGG